MNTKSLVLSLSALCAFTFLSCEKNETDATKGTARIEVTDAPFDDANIKGAFVTIADVKLDGQSLEGFNKTTIDLAAFQKGNTKLLGISELDAKTYSSVTLVLDYEKDQNGNAPGCYVLEVNDTKHKLLSADTELTLNHNYAIEAGQETALVVDFDLRKSIKREQNATDQYDFVSEAELESAIRVVAKNKASVIKGNCQDLVSNSDKLVVYAYKKGQFNLNTETDGQGASDIEFSKAITSATVAANGDYELHFLDQGEYELHFAAYDKNDSTGKMELKGTLVVSSTNSINLGAIALNASTTLTVGVLVVALLPL